jgi:hypothetical protein
MADPFVGEAVTEYGDVASGRIALKIVGQGGRGNERGRDSGHDSRWPAAIKRPEPVAI